MVIFKDFVVENFFGRVEIGSKYNNWGNRKVLVIVCGFFFKGERSSGRKVRYENGKKRVCLREFGS